MPVNLVASPGGRHVPTLVCILLWGGVPLAAEGPAATEGPGALDDAPRVVAAALPDGEHPLAPAIRLAQGTLTRLQAIDDYEATFLRRERAGGQTVEHTVHLKVREKPLSLYLKYGEPHLGRQLLFVQGENENQVLIHDPQGTSSPNAKGAGVDPSTVIELGMRQRLEKVIGQWKYETAYGECDVQFYPEAKLRGLSCEVIESSHPRPRRQFPFHKTRLYIDAETHLPIRFEQYAFSETPEQTPPLVEFHEYLNLRTNVGLSDADFDRRNPNYSF
ncbi:MAG: DUF1571 domain-containing protein [Planctomycetaceae bacterium]|nr:DUF1571 domain-containing protein [Planctomycetaceae bacterium]